MSKENSIHECLPKIGFLFDEDTPTPIICKPKLMPLKTVTLEKVKKGQKSIFGNLNVFYMPS